MITKKSTLRLDTPNNMAAYSSLAHSNNKITKKNRLELQQTAQRLQKSFKNFD